MLATAVWWGSASQLHAVAAACCACPRAGTQPSRATQRPRARARTHAPPGTADNRDVQAAAAQGWRIKGDPTAAYAFLVTQCTARDHRSRASGTLAVQLLEHIVEVAVAHGGDK